MEQGAFQFLSRLRTLTDFRPIAPHRSKEGTSSPLPSPPQACGGEGDTRVAQIVKWADRKSHADLKRLLRFLQRGDAVGHHGVGWVPAAAQGFDQEDGRHGAFAV